MTQVCFTISRYGLIFTVERSDFNREIKRYFIQNRFVLQSAAVSKFYTGGKCDFDQKKSGGDLSNIDLIYNHLRSTSFYRLTIQQLEARLQILPSK